MPDRDLNLLSPVCFVNTAWKLHKGLRQLCGTGMGEISKQKQLSKKIGTEQYEILVFMR